MFCMDRDGLYCLIEEIEEINGFIRDDFQRFGADNFVSGIRYALEVLKE